MWLGFVVVLVVMLSHVHTSNNVDLEVVQILDLDVVVLLQVHNYLNQIMTMFMTSRFQ